MGGSIRLKRGIGLALATAVASVGAIAAAGSAYAADELDVNINQYGLQLPAVVNGISVTKTLQVSVYHDMQGKVGPAKVTVDASGLSGIAQVIWPAGCTHQGSVGTCTDVHVNTLNPASPWTSLNIGLRALRGVKNGAQGTVQVAAATATMTARTNFAPVSVSVGADLAVHPLPQLNNVKVGPILREPISWTNTGDVTSPRSRVTFFLTPGLAFEQHLKNCTYSLAGRQAVCTVNTAIKPGQTLRLPAPMAVRVTKDAWYTIMGVGVTPLGQPHKAAPAQLNPHDSYTELDVRAKNHAHFVAVGATVRAAAGRTVPVTVGMRNLGPATIYDRSGGEGVGAIEIVFPKGTTVVKVPKNCGFQPKQSWSPLPARYMCNIPWMATSGLKDLNTFTLRVDKVVPNAHGEVWLGNMLSDIKGRGTANYPWDPSSAGHAAAIVLNP